MGRFLKNFSILLMSRLCSVDSFSPCSSLRNNNDSVWLLSMWISFPDTSIYLIKCSISLDLCCWSVALNVGPAKCVYIWTAAFFSLLLTRYSWYFEVHRCNIRMTQKKINVFDLILSPLCVKDCQEQALTHLRRNAPEHNTMVLPSGSKILKLWKEASSYKTKTESHNIEETIEILPG